MLRYKTKSRPGLVALYDIRPWNGAGPFLQPRSPHGAGHFNKLLRRILIKKSFEWWDTFSAGTGAVFTNCLGSATPAVARGRPQSSPGAANEWKFFFW